MLKRIFILHERYTLRIHRINPNQRPAEYCTAIKHGTKDDWDFLWTQYEYSNFASEQAVILQALGCTDDVSILET